MADTDLPWTRAISRDDLLAIVVVIGEGEVLAEADVLDEVASIIGWLEFPLYVGIVLDRHATLLGRCTYLLVGATVRGERDHRLAITLGEIHGDTRLDVGELVSSSLERHIVEGGRECNRLRNSTRSRPRFIHSRQRSYGGPSNQSLPIGRGARRHSHVTREVACASVDTMLYAIFTSPCVMIITPDTAQPPQGYRLIASDDLSSYRSSAQT